MPSLRRSAGGLAVVAVLATGCGGGGGTSDADQVKAAVTSFVRAVSSGDVEAACGRLTPVGERRLIARTRVAVGRLVSGRLTCEQAMGLIRTAAGPALLRDLAAADVTGVKVSAPRATAVLVGTGDIGRRVVVLRRSGSTWRLDRVPGFFG